MFRTDKPARMQYLLVFGCSCVAWTLYLIAAVGMSALTS